VIFWSFFRDSQDLAKILEDFSFWISGFGAKSFPLLPRLWWLPGNDGALKGWGAFSHCALALLHLETIEPSTPTCAAGPLRVPGAWVKAGEYVSGKWAEKGWDLTSAQHLDESKSCWLIPYMSCFFKDVALVWQVSPYADLATKNWRLLATTPLNSQGWPRLLLQSVCVQWHVDALQMKPDAQWQKEVFCHHIGKTDFNINTSLLILLSYISLPFWFFTV